jgi:hypothetical protein
MGTRIEACAGGGKPEAVEETKAMRSRSQLAIVGWFLATLVLIGGTASSAEEAPKPQFRYAAGTESIPEGCEGNLELTSEALTFKCLEGEVTAPFDSISLMQYRSDVSKKIRRLKVRWKLRPPFQIPFFHSRRNHFFSVTYRLEGTTHVLVLEVAPQAMRPYLAEIDLRAEKRVEVESFEDY